MIKEEKQLHGGKREGAGRKPLSKKDKKVTVSISLEPELKLLARNHPKGLSGLCGYLLKNYFKF